MRFKTKALAIACTIAFVAAGANAHAAVLRASVLPLPPTAAQRLVFDDEFSSPKTGWDTCYPWWPATSHGCTNEGNPDEQEWYVPSGVVSAGGSALLTARRQLTTGTFRGTPK